MAFVSQTVRLDMKPQKNPPHVDCTQYDSGTDGLLIHFVLFNDGSEFSVPSGYTAKLEGTTKENTGFIIDPYSIDTNGVSFNLTEDATAFKGSAWCKIVFEKGSSRISTSGFWLDCDRAGVEAATVIGADGFEEQIVNAVNDWLDEHPPSGGGGLTEEVKQALLACFRSVMWFENEGEYYDALYNALYPPVDVLSISAVFTQGEAVIYDTDSLDTLKQYLVVTATMTDSTTRTLEDMDYTLSGTLAEGTSVITVSYGGKTTTFNVTVTADRNVIDIDNSGFRITSLNPAQNDPSYPYYFDNAPNSPKRYSYPAFDLRLEGGKKYKFTAECNYSTAQMGCQFSNQNVLDAVAVQGSYAISNIYDPGWQSLTTEIDIPANQNNSPIVGVRFTFRQDTNNTNISNDFAISRLTVEEVTA